LSIIDIGTTEVCRFFYQSKKKTEPEPEEKSLSCQRREKLQGEKADISL
jgi:hypothetical protein